jgi:hypothetical protein
VADIHIDDFCRDAAKILLQLYSVFPRRSSVYVMDISGPDEPGEVGLHSDRHMACLGTMLWLAEEDFLRFEDMIYQDGIDLAILSSKSFTLLSAISDYHVQEPDGELTVSLQVERLTMVEQIRAALRSGESATISAIMRYFLTSSPTTVLPLALENKKEQPC